jgi:predicted AlkP superfamily pyrophosphatase or phosphodiesterase
MLHKNSFYLQFKKTLTLSILMIGILQTGCSSKQTDGAKDPQRIEGFVKAQPQIFRFNENARNSEEAKKAPYVVLVSLDGFRHDYAEKYNASTLLSIPKNGVQTKGLIPVYPSKTFPNHYSIVTGLYADEHKLVSNEFVDPQTEETYSIGGSGVTEGKWYDGEPLWATAQRNGFLTASLFWVGSEAPIRGIYPNWYAKYDGKVDNFDRVDQVINWLKLPEDERPHFITTYFSLVDDAGHAKGPESKEVANAVKQIDDVIAQLRERLSQTGLPINLMIVSDHGMEALDSTKIIVLNQEIDLSKFTVSGQGTMIKLYLKKGFLQEREEIIKNTVSALKAEAGNYRVWTRQEMKKFNFSKSDRTGDIIIEPDAPYLVYVKPPASEIRGGNHGWDPKRFTSMHGIFFAEGPAFKRDTRLAAFENIHIFPLVAKVLGLKNLPKVSGKLSVTQSALVK